MCLRPNKPAAVGAAFIFVAGIGATGLLVPREVGPILTSCYFVSFFGYFWLVKSDIPTKWLFVLGIVARVMMMIKMPALSDDIYRFLWDGFLLRSGISPYVYLPGELLNRSIPYIGHELFDKLNSQPYYSVYPPLNQVFFWASVLAGHSNLLSANIMRFGLIVADLGSLFYLVKMTEKNQLGPKTPFWFFLNPLLVIEAIGNVHFEGLVVFFMLLGLYYFYCGRLVRSSMGFGLAVAAKLLPLIYLPVLFFSSPKGKGFYVCLLAGFFAGIALSPFLFSGALAGVQSGLGLYFQKFEFNASIYFLLRAIGFWAKGYNIIEYLGPWLSAASFLSIMAIAILGKIRNWQLPQTMLFSLVAYLLLSTVVHPWYILPLVPLGLLAGFYFPVVWSLVVFVSYLGYIGGGYELSMHWVVLEYTVVFFAMAIELYEKYEAKML